VASKQDIPTATYFPMVLVKCEVAGGELDWCQTDSGKGVWASQKIDSVTPTMRAAVIVASIIGPAFLAVYFAYDQWFKKQQ
jgi:hypothetical protein